MRERPLILVVDDMPDNVEIAKLRLEKEGYAVATAVDGEQALASIRAEAPDLVLLDVMMPKLDGIEVTKRVKADKSEPGVDRSVSPDLVSGIRWDHLQLVVNTGVRLESRPPRAGSAGHRSLPRARHGQYFPTAQYQRHRIDDPALR